VTAGFDIGTEQKAKGRSDINIWYTTVLIGKYTISDQCAVAARVEYYSDEGGVIVAPDLKTMGYSVNFHYAPRSNAVFRIEGRLLQGCNAIFSTADGVLKKQLLPDSLAGGIVLRKYGQIPVSYSTKPTKSIPRPSIGAV